MSIERLSGGLTPADGSDPRTFPEIFNEFADEFEGKNLPAFSAVAPTDGQVPVFDAVEGVFVPGEGGGLPSNAFAFVGTVTFESNGTFSKGDFPFLRAVRVKCQGGGGGSGSCDGVTDGETVASGAGGGGAFAESFITNIASITSSVTVNVGLGGSGGASGGAGNGESGSQGGTSSFGGGELFEVSAQGGFGGGRGFEGNQIQGAGGRLGNQTAIGQTIISGGASAFGIGFGTGFYPNGPIVFSAPGGPSQFGTGGGGAVLSGLGFTNGSDGRGNGSGAGGAITNGNGASVNGAAGGDGADGIVIVELFA